MRFLFVFAAFLGSFQVYSQGFITGTVSDESTREPLQGVYVVHSRDKGTITGPEGEFIIESSQPEITLTFRFIGYRDVTSKTRIKPGDTIVLNILMQTALKEIGDIVVSANRTEQKISELTVSMDVIKSEDIARGHITDSKELINKTPGIEVLDGQASIRGGTGFSYGVGSRVLALIDGLPLLSPDAGSIKWQFLPMENIAQIEIIKGASSVLYGSSALNGIINFRTAPASNIPETKFFAEAGIFGKTSNPDWKWWDEPRFFSSLSFSHLQKSGKNDLGVAAGLTRNAGYRKYNDETLGRLSLRLKHYSENVKGLSYGVNINSGYTDKTDFVLWENSNTGALIQDTSSVSDLIGKFIAIDPFISFDNNGSLNHDLRLRIQSSSNMFPERSRNNSDARSVYGEYQSHYAISENLGLIAGISMNYSSILSTFFGDHIGFNFAGFAQGESSFGRLKMVAGVRLEHNSLDGINDRLVPIFRAGANWQAAEYTFIRGSFGQGYRYPSVAEKFASTSLGAVRIYPNPGIGSETGWSSELGVKQGLMFGEIRGQADLSVFLSQNRDLIEYVFGYYPDPRTGVFDFGFQATNIEQSRIYGYEIEFLLQKTSGKLNAAAGGGYTYIYPSQFNPNTGENTNNYLKYRRKHSLKLSGNAGYNRFGAGLTLFYRSKILDIDDVFVNPLTRESILPGFFDYWQANNEGYFTADASFSFKLNDNYTFSFAVKNLTNTEYMGRPGDIQPHRNYSLRFAGIF
jgi:outer membrane receptor protein involved in Fe transport